MRKYETDLTEGNVTKQLLGFAMPFFVAQILQACYSMADMLIAGRFMGDYGIAAINNSSICIMLITMLVNGFALSGTVLVAQYVGAKQPDNAKKTIGTLFTVFIYCAVVVTIFGVLFTNRIVVLLKIPAEAMGEARNYLRICFSGTIFICGYNAVSAVLRGLGDSKRPLYFVAVATVANVVLDLIFVGGFGWGAAGAAFATILAQALSFGLSVHTLYKNNFVFDFKFKSFVIKKDKLKMILKIGLPSALQSTIVNFSMLFVLTTINSYGLAASTAAGIGAKIDSFAILPTIAVSQSVASMVGQNLGAGCMARAKETVFAGVRVSLSFGAAIYLFVNIFGIKIVDIFNCSPTTVEVALMYIKYVSIYYIANAVMFIFNGLAVGSGNSIFALGNALLSVIIVRIPLIFIFQNVMGFGLKGVFMAMGLAQYAGVITAGLFYISGKWKKSLVK